MPKKQAAKLLHHDDRIFAVLSPGHGFLKYAYGDVEFTDALPRASGSFRTRDEAHAAWTKAIEDARAQVEAGKTRYGGKPGNYFHLKAQKILSQAHNAILVEISVRGVV